jgi:hypothetical protein
MRKRRSINAKLKRRSINAKFDTIIRNARGPPSFAPPEAATTDKTASQASKQALFDYLGLPSNADTYSRQGVARSSGGALRTVQRSLVVRTKRRTLPSFIASAFKSDRCSENKSAKAPPLVKLRFLSERKN